jgi:putative hemolysin
VSPYLQFALILGLAVVNGLFAMAEMAVVSSRPTRLQTLVDHNKNGAAVALELASDPGRFLSTLQLGMTLVGVLSGAFSGATVGINLSQWLAGLGLPIGVAHFLGVGFVVATTTYLTVIVGELAPKRIALKNPEAIACAIAPFMAKASVKIRPLVLFLERSSDVLLFMAGQSEDNLTTVTDEEIRKLAEEAEHAGNIKAGESRLISRVLKLGDGDAKSLMTPRDKVETVDLNAPLDAAITQIVQSPFRCFPVYDINPDRIIGLIWAKDLVRMDEARQTSLRPFIREAPSIPQTADMLIVVNVLRHARMHMGIVQDDDGVFVGLITAADILESIVGAFERQNRQLTMDDN